MGTGLEMSYKDIVKDEKSLIKYLEDLVVRDDIDMKNKIFSACMVGRFFEFEKLLVRPSTIGLKEFFESHMQNVEDEK